MKGVKILTILMLGFVLITSCQNNKKTYEKEKSSIVHLYELPDNYPVENIKSPTGTEVKNVILMIGDGMRTDSF